jgi:hypothetical protein
MAKLLLEDAPKPLSYLDRGLDVLIGHWHSMHDRVSSTTDYVDLFCEQDVPATDGFEVSWSP